MTNPKISIESPKSSQFAAAELGRVLKVIQKIPALRKRGPRVPRWQVALALIEGPKMRRLNAKYRGKSSVTDVLSFEAPPVFFNSGLLGELVICKSVLKRQAKEQGQSEVQELKILLVHGVLHLLGFDHELSAKAAREMALAEKKLLKLLGVDVGLIQRTLSVT